MNPYDTYDLGYRNGKRNERDLTRAHIREHVRLLRVQATALRRKASHEGSFVLDRVGDVLDALEAEIRDGAHTHPSQDGNKTTT
jgi:hypothetical protein